MLHNCRALDLTDDKGFLCGKILADLGVDVIKIEKPGGDISRRIGPFYGDQPDPQKSLYWFAYNSNKRGITLNVDTQDGRQIFKELVKTADFIIESFPPGYMRSLGLGYDELDSIKSGIILTSISPFGQSGPYSHYHASDIVIMSMSGMLYQTGEADQPPLHMSLSQACMHAGADAAVASLIAYYHRQRTGYGQHVDVSMQQSSAWFLANAVPFWELNRVILKRAGVFRWSNNSMQRQVWKCRDGYVFFFMLGGKQGAKTFRELVRWMDEAGISDKAIKSIDWETLDMGSATQEVVDTISKPIEKFFLSLSKKEITKGAAERKLSMCPLASMQDLINSEQLRSRDFWATVNHPELSASVIYPREFAKCSEARCQTVFRAPLTGEHNVQVYKEIGLMEHDLIVLKEAGVI